MSRTPRLAAVALGLLALAGCGSTDPDGPTAAPRVSASTSPSTSAATTSASPTTTARCTTSDLRFSLSPGDGAAGSTYVLLRMTNTSDAACRTRGFGGVSFVSAPSGAPIGAPAVRVQRSEVRRLTLAPGATAEATLRETNAENYPAATCRPTPAKGLRVYPPDETRSVFLRHPATACAAKQVHLLELAPYLG